MPRWSHAPLPDSTLAHSFTVPRPPYQAQKTGSTLAERFVGGLILGSLAATAASQLLEDEATVAAYVLGSAGGVWLATAARERPRTAAILIGTAFGAVPLLAIAGQDEANPATLLLGVVGGITTPLLGGIGQHY